MKLLDIYLYCDLREALMRFRKKSFGSGVFIFPIKIVFVVCFLLGVCNKALSVSAFPDQISTTLSLIQTLDNILNSDKGMNGNFTILNLKMDQVLNNQQLLMEGMRVIGKSIDDLKSAIPEMLEDDDFKGIYRDVDVISTEFNQLYIRNSTVAEKIPEYQMHLNNLSRTASKLLSLFRLTDFNRDGLVAISQGEETLRLLSNITWLAINFETKIEFASRWGNQRGYIYQELIEKLTEANELLKTKLIIEKYNFEKIEYYESRIDIGKTDWGGFFFRQLEKGKFSDLDISILWLISSNNPKISSIKHRIFTVKVGYKGKENITDPFNNDILIRTQELLLHSKDYVGFGFPAGFPAQILQAKMFPLTVPKQSELLSDELLIPWSITFDTGKVISGMTGLQEAYRSVSPSEDTLSVDLINVSNLVKQLGYRATNIIVLGKLRDISEKLETGLGSITNSLNQKLREDGVI
ncbi:MAG: hypothetical protein JAZ17_04480 [Candidatus Thiodiazotropha endolucinida]|nr:hypothetical protein [Candidatus Thiodiazotropha endolucinida]